MTDDSVKAPILYGVGAIRALGERVRGFDRALMAEVAKETESSHLSDFGPIKVTHELALENAYGVYDHYE